MTKEVIINILDTGGGGSPPEADPEEDGLYLPDAFEGIFFFAEIEFLFEETIVDPETQEETSIITTPFAVESDFDFANFGLTFTKVDDSDNIVRIEGGAINVFLDQFYEFVLPDLSTAVLPPNTDVDFFSLIKYQKPGSNTTLFEYKFKVYENANSFIEVSVFQTIIWRFDSAAANIDAIVARGIK